MIPTQETHNLTTNITDSDEDTKMSVDPEDFGKLLDSLTRIYPNEHLAVMREYAANGCDAHLVAGQTRPIEITLPNPNNPYVTFQDWGTGMSFVDIDTIYGKYGKSTKEKSENEFGYFGLGSKSALNICDSFTLISVKDGEKSVILIYRGTDRIGRLRKISVTRTDEPNGTIVKIPSDRFDDFREAAKRIFPTWARGSVLVNGEAPQYIDDDPQYHAVGNLGYVNTTMDTSVIFRDNYKSDIKVILGGITYRIGELSKAQLFTVFGSDLAKISKRLRGQEILVRFESMSDLPILPSREEIAINEYSLPKIGEKVQAMLNIFVQEIKEKINTAPSVIEALTMGQKYRFAVDNTIVTWRDTPIPGSASERGMEYWGFANGRKSRLDLPYIPIRSNTKFLVVNKKDCTISDATILNHLKIWAHQKNVDLGSVALWTRDVNKFENMYAQSMVETGHITFVNATEVIEVSREYKKGNRRTGRPATRSIVRYPSYAFENNVLTMNEYTADDMIDSGKPVYFIQQERYASGINSAFMVMNRLDGKLANCLNRAFTYLDKNALVVMVSMGRKATALESRLTGVAPVYNGMDALNNALFAKALSDSTTVADQLVTSIIKQRNGTCFQIFDRDDVESNVLREVGRRIENKELASDISRIMADAVLLLSVNEKTFNERLSQLAKDSGVGGRDIVNKTALELIYDYYPLLGPVMGGISYRVRNGGCDNAVNDLIEYVNMITRRDGDFSIN